jgi:hypothetical protein
MAEKPGFMIDVVGKRKAEDQYPRKDDGGTGNETILG